MIFEDIYNESTDSNIRKSIEKINEVHEYLKKYPKTLEDFEAEIRAHENLLKRNDITIETAMKQLLYIAKIAKTEKAVKEQAEMDENNSIFDF